MPVNLGLPNEKDYPHPGHLDFAATTLTPTTGTLLIRGIFSNPDGKILPGLYARVRVPVEKKAAFLVPQVAVGNDQRVRMYSSSTRRTSWNAAASSPDRSWITSGGSQKASRGRSG